MGPPLSILLIVPAALAATLEVPGDSPTISGGIDLAQAGDTILVAAGTWTERINPRGKSLLIQGQGAGQTVVLPPDSLEVESGGLVRMFTGEDRDTRLRGFTLRGGRAEVGGAIFLDAGVQAEFQDCDIEQSVATSRGGGVFCNGSDASFLRCRIRDNYTDGGGAGIYFWDGGGGAFDQCEVSRNIAGLDGGGIRVFRSSPTISSCSVDSNQAGDDGAGIYVFRDASPLIEGSVVTGNTAFDDGAGIKTYFASPIISRTVFDSNVAIQNGGGIYCENSYARISLCTIVSNRAANQGAGISCDESADPLISHCIVRDNTSQRLGGGIGCDRGATPEIRNCLVIGNRAQGWGGGVSAEGASNLQATHLTLIGNTAGQGGSALVSAFASTVDLGSSIIWGHTGLALARESGSLLLARYSDIQGGYQGIGNRDAPPRFLSFGGIDYLLQAGSPCIDTGEPGTQDSVPWPVNYPNGLPADMGAYGGPDGAGWLDS